MAVRMKKVVSPARTGTPCRKGGAVLRRRELGPAGEGRPGVSLTKADSAALWHAVQVQADMVRAMRDMDFTGPQEARRAAKGEP